MTKLKFEEIHPNNWRVDIKVAEEQKHYVSDLPHSLARAYAYRNQRCRAYLIYHESECIGFGMYYDCDECNAYVLSEFFIDARQQGKGYGKSACVMMLDEMEVHFENDAQSELLLS